MRSQTFDRLSFLSIFLTIILLPFFFLPFTSIPVETSKGLVLVIGLVACVIFWAIARFFDGKITIPRSSLILAGVGMVLAFFLSAIFSKVSQVSLFGTMFDIGSFWFMFAAFLLFLMSAITFRDPKSARLVLFGIILSSIIVLLFQTLRLFAPDALSFGLLVGKTANILGSWNAFGFFAGFASLVSLIVIEFFTTTPIEKLTLEILIVLSLLLVAAVNFSLIWIMLGVFALIIFVYKVSVISNEDNSGKKSYFPVFSFIVILIALLFFISGQFIGGILPNKLGLQNAEINPSFQATITVTKSVLKEDPVFGMGPNRFGEAWASYKPEAINNTQFFSVYFNTGSGLLPTLAATTGALGILSLVIFFALFLWGGLKSILKSIKSGSGWETMAFFVLSLYLFVASFFYFTGMVLFLVAFAFTGVFVGLSTFGSSRSDFLFSFSNDRKKGFLSVFFLVIIIIASAATLFKYTERLVSVSSFRKALSAPDVATAETNINKALSLYVNDLYLRTYSQVYLLKLNSLIKKESLSEGEKDLLQPTLDQAVNGAQLATKYDPMNYLNFQGLGTLYQSLSTFGVKDADTNAIEAFKVAAELSPRHPGLQLSITNSYMKLGKIKEAKNSANAALALKPNYIDAYLILSQIAKNEGDNAGANSYAQKALALDPLNKDIIKYIDSLKNPPASAPAVEDGSR